MNTYSFLAVDELMGAGNTAKEKVIAMWKKELQALEDNEENKEKREKLAKYIKQGEECLKINYKAKELLWDLEKLDEFEE